MTTPWRLPDTPFFQFDKSNTDVLILAAIRTAAESRDATKGLKMAISAYTSVMNFRNLHDDIEAEFASAIKSLARKGASLAPEISKMKVKIESDDLDVAVSASGVLNALEDAKKLSGGKSTKRTLQKKRKTNLKRSSFKRKRYNTKRNSYNSRKEKKTSKSRSRKTIRKKIRKSKKMSKRSSRI